MRVAARGLLLTGIACGVAGLAGSGPAANGAAAGRSVPSGPTASRAEAGLNPRAAPAWTRPAWTRASCVRVPGTRVPGTRFPGTGATWSRSAWRMTRIGSPLSRRARPRGARCGVPGAWAGQHVAAVRVTALGGVSGPPGPGAWGDTLAWAGLAALVLLAGGLLAAAVSRLAVRMTRRRAGRFAPSPDEPDVVDISHLVDRTDVAEVIDVTSESEWGWAPGRPGSYPAAETSREAPGQARQSPA